MMCNLAQTQTAPAPRIPPPPQPERPQVPTRSQVPTPPPPPSALQPSSDTPSPPPPPAGGHRKALAAKVEVISDDDTVKPQMNAPAKQRMGKVKQRSRSQMHSLQEANLHCPHCRRRATGKADMFHEKFAEDKRTNEFHDVGLKTGEGTIFIGVLTGGRTVNDVYTNHQLTPFDEIPYNLQCSLDSCLIFDAITEKQKDHWHYRLPQVAKTKKLTWFYWKSAKARLFAVQCKTCLCACVYEWDKHEASANKRAGVCWILAFMLTNPEGCMNDEPEPIPSCARWGKHRLGQSGLMPTDGEAEGSDWDMCQSELC